MTISGGINAKSNANLVIQAGKLINGTGSEPISPGLVAITGDRIIYAGSVKDAPSISGAQVLDFPDSCILPGLIDSHVHATYYWDEINSAPYSYDPEGAVVYSPTLIGLLAASRLHKALMAGVTTVRDAGSVNTILFDVRRAIQLGLISGSRVYASGRLIVPSGGHVNFLPGFSHEADGPYGFRAAVRQEIGAGADFIKLANNNNQYTPDELSSAIDEAHRLGKKVVCHTLHPPSQRLAIEAGVDSFEHGSPTPEEIDLAVTKGVAWTPTLNILHVYLEWAKKHSLDPNPQKAAGAREILEYFKFAVKETRVSMGHALKAGLRILAGTDSFLRDAPFEALPDELCYLVEFGCSPMQAILAATASPAEVMGWQDLGILETGKIADVIAVKGDPLTDINILKRVHLVIHDGVVVKNITNNDPGVE